MYKNGNYSTDIFITSRFISDRKVTEPIRATSDNNNVFGRS